MKLKGMAVAAALLACSGGAYAQSAVTLYGVIDAGLEFVNHAAPFSSTNAGAAFLANPGTGNNVYRLNSGGLSGSRWGLRGTEDLGGGLKSVFVLESGFSVDNGTMQQSSRLFGRQAFVGLSHSTFGQVTLGRQYTSLFAAMANFMPTAYATQYEPAAFMAGNNFREDNTVAYTGAFGPFTALAHFSFGAGVPSLPLGTIPPATQAIGGANGETPGAFRRDNAFGVAGVYSAGPFGAAIAYDQWNPSINNLAGTPTGSTATLKKASVAGSYAIGQVAKIMAGYRWGEANNHSNGSQLQRDDYYWIGANYQVTPAVGLTLEYDYDNLKRDYSGNTHAANPWQIAFVADYTFSKRTDVYLSAAYAKNAGLTLDSANTNQLATTGATGNSYILGNGQSNMLGVSVGLRHKF